MKLHKLILPLIALAMLLSSCDEAVLDEGFDMDSYTFTEVDQGQDNYHYDDEVDEDVSHNPYNPVTVDDPYEDININVYQEPIYPDAPEYPTIPGPVEDNQPIPEATPENVKYAVTDLAKRKYTSKVNIIEDDAYYANLAIGLAQNEISHMGFETFRAFAVVYNEVTEEVDYYIPGIAFTDGTIYDYADDKAIFSCGFMQIDEDGHPAEFLLSDTKGDNLIDVSAGIMVFPNDENDERQFIIESNTVVEGFSGIYDSHYFSYKQESSFVIKVVSKFINDDIENIMDDEIDLYDFNNSEFLYKASIFHKQRDLSAFGLYGERGAKAYQAAVEMLDEAIRIQEENGLQIALNNIIIISNDLLDNLQLSTQRKAVNDMADEYLSAIELKENEYLMLGPNGEFTIGVDYNYQAARESNLTSGIIKTLTSIGMLGAGFACIVATGGAATPILAGLMFCDGLCATAFAASELIEGVQQLYMGATGIYHQEAINPIKDKFKEWMGDDLGEKLYYAAGIASLLGTSLFGPVNTVLSQSCLANGTVGVAETVLRVTRVVVVGLAKAVISGGVALTVNKIVTKATEKLGLSSMAGKLISYGSTILAAILTYKGLNTLDRAFNISGLARVSPIDASELEPQPDPINSYKRNDMDMIDAVNDKYMTKNYYYKNEWAKEIIKNGYYEQGVTTNVRLKSFSWGDEYVFGPMMKRLNDSTDGDENSPIAGFYNPNTKTIYIDADVLQNDGLKTLRTLAHLIRHVYQFEKAEFNSPVLRALRQEYYVNYDESLYDYLNNPAEIDANAYADYIVARAMRAYNAKLENVDLEEFINEIEFPDPETFKEAH